MVAQPGSFVSWRLKCKFCAEIFSIFGSNANLEDVPTRKQYHKYRGWWEYFFLSTFYSRWSEVCAILITYRLEEQKGTMFDMDMYWHQTLLCSKQA